MKEIWKPIPGWAGQYEVSNLGRVRSLGRTRSVFNPDKNVKYTMPLPGKILNAKPALNGYKIATLIYQKRKKQEYVHRLVLRAFKGRPRRGLEACHDNGIRTDNRLINLRWDSRRSNSLDRRKHGTVFFAHGTENAQSKFSKCAIKWIRKNASKFSQRDLAALFGVSHSTIGNVIRKNSYKNVR